MLAYVAIERISSARASYDQKSKGLFGRVPIVSPSANLSCMMNINRINSNRIN